MVADLARIAPAQEEFAEAPPFARGLFLARSAIGRWAAMDMARLSLWAPVMIGIGAGLYFGLKSEPSWHWAAAALATGFMVASWRSPLQGAGAALMFAALGFIAADIRTEAVEAPQLTRELGAVWTTGRILSVDESARQRRYVLALSSIEGVDPDHLPARARITWRGKEFDAGPGDLVRVRARLSPPPPPVAPGHFDFARQLYFQQIGAVGIAFTAPSVDPLTEQSRGQKLAARIEAVRGGLARRITGKAPGQGGAILAAIVTGKRGAISEASEAALRDAGLAHLLAISGLHMGLATGLVFFALRFGLAAIEPVALRFPIKKWAAAAALASGLFYLILSGGGWSARRAFIMAAIMFAAILVDRRALSLRNVAIAAVIILLTTPEALFSPGFQMSFAAVTALIAAYEWVGARAKPDQHYTWVTQIRRFIVALALTDSVSALATAPYALFHFNRVAIYSLPANMAAMPIMGFCIVPFAVLALLLTPLGLDGWAWQAAAWWMDWVLRIAGGVSGLDGAVSITAQWPQSAMLALTAGGLWLCLSRAPWRLAGLAAIPVAALLVMNTRPPVLFVSATGTNAGVIAENEAGERALYVHAVRREKFATSMWEEAAGFDPERERPQPLSEIYQCDESGCTGAVMDRARVTAAFVSEKARLAEDCQRAELVVAFFPVSAEEWRQCRAFLIDRRSVWRRGAHAVWIERDGKLRVETVSDVRGDRPWTGGG
ncbi:ComEC/Rec2 family competence protein [Hyphococcus sp.]|uniref:ComEC/Rec2 family competence protein n=1 Tax=Hyphococcus sp. TaxID=2038636 RepID=UPI002080561D|nr:MAG: competence protein ComEC [Marinicaulis sp.]